MEDSQQNSNNKINEQGAPTVDASNSNEGTASQNLANTTSQNNAKDPKASKALEFDEVTAHLFTLTVEDTVKRLEQGNVGRSDVSILTYCHKGKLKCMKFPALSGSFKFMIEPGVSVYF